MDVIPIATVMIRVVSWAIHGAGTSLGVFMHILSHHLGGGVMSPLQEPIRVGIVLGSDSEEETGPSVDIRGVGARNLSSQPRAPPAQS